MKTKLNYWAIALVLFATTEIAAQYKEHSWKERDEWMNVEELLQWANVSKDATVADIGCHEGYLSMHLARRVGDQGKVYSVDVREDRLEKLEENARKRKLKNIIPTVGDYDDPKLPKNTMDAVFVVDTYHEIDEYETMLAHIRKALKPGGRVLILEKLKNHIRNKTRNEQTNAHSLSPKYVRKELKEAGFTITGEYRDIGFWENETSKKIWVLVAVVPDA